MEWARLILDYLKVLAWPVVVITLGFIFRRAITRLIDRIRRGRAAGIEVELDQTAEVLLEAEKLIELSQDDGIENDASQIQENHISESDSNKDVQNFSETGSTQSSRSEQMDDRADVLRRLAIDDILMEGARIGFEWAHEGEPEPPDLAVYWGEDGKPSVDFAPSRMLKRRAIPSLKPGDRITHDTFGLGSVLALEGRGRHSAVIVDFGGKLGTKRLVLQYAPIEKL
jgi:PcrA/UvrD helicase-like protein